MKPAPAHRGAWIRAVLPTLWLLCGCSSDGTQLSGSDAGGVQCPSDLPPSCPPAVPSYQTDIAPIVLAKCTTCHRVGGVEDNRPLGTYSDLYASRSEVLHQVYGCLMPPAANPQLDAGERQKILTWLVCQSPNN